MIQLLLRAGMMPNPHPNRNSVPMVCTFYPRMGGKTFPTLLPTSRQPHPALSLPCCHPGVLAQELLSWEGARRSQIPAWLQGTIHLSDGSRGASR